MSLHKSKLPGAENCPIRDVMTRVSDRWSVLALVELGDGPLRFGALAEQIPDISERMLSKTLRQLEEDGLVKRTQYPEKPPRVEYELTSLGHSLLAPVSAMIGWAEQNHQAVREARTEWQRTSQT